jgi:hypothetical protein
MLVIVEVEFYHLFKSLVAHHSTCPLGLLGSELLREREAELSIDAALGTSREAGRRSTVSRVYWLCVKLES